MDMVNVVGGPVLVNPTKGNFAPRLLLCCSHLREHLAVPITSGLRIHWTENSPTKFVDFA
jgi:hypothetical protein